MESKSATAAAASAGVPLEDGAVTEPVVVAEDVENDDPYVP